jgi:hypothetical protein
LSIGVTQEQERCGLLHIALWLFREAGLVGDKLVPTLKRIDHNYIWRRLKHLEQCLRNLIVVAALGRSLASPFKPEKPMSDAELARLNRLGDEPVYRTNWPIPQFGVPDPYDDGPLWDRLPWPKDECEGFEKEPEPLPTRPPLSNDLVDARWLSLRLLSFKRALDTFDAQVERLLLKRAKRRNRTIMDIRDHPPRPWRPKPLFSNKPRPPKVPKVPLDHVWRFTYHDSS